MDDIPERISPPRVEARVYIAVDGGDWVAGHDETYVMAQVTLTRSSPG